MLYPQNGNRIVAIDPVTSSGETSHQQPRQRGPKTVKGAQSDPNYVSRLLLDCAGIFFTKSSPLPTYFTVRSECLPGGPKIIVTPLVTSHHPTYAQTPRNVARDRQTDRVGGMTSDARGSARSGDRCRNAMSCVIDSCSSSSSSSWV